MAWMPTQQQETAAGQDHNGLPWKWKWRYHRRSTAYALGSRMVSSLAKGSLGASYMQVPESGTLVHGTPEASVRGKLGLSSLGRVYMGLKLVGLQAPRMMGVISTESCSTECFDLEGNRVQQAVGLLLDESTSPLKWIEPKQAPVKVKCNRSKSNAREGL